MPEKCLQSRRLWVNSPHPRLGEGGVYSMKNVNSAKMYGFAIATPFCVDVCGYSWFFKMLQLLSKHPFASMQGP